MASPLAARALSPAHQELHLAAKPPSPPPERRPGLGKHTRYGRPLPWPRETGRRMRSSARPALSSGICWTLRLMRTAAVPECLCLCKLPKVKTFKKAHRSIKAVTDFATFRFFARYFWMNEEVTLLGCFSACDQSQSAFFCHSASIPTSLRVQNVAPPYGPRGTSESGHAQSVQDAGQEASAQSWCPFRESPAQCRH